MPHRGTKGTRGSQSHCHLDSNPQGTRASGFLSKGDVLLKLESTEAETKLTNSTKRPVLGERVVKAKCRGTGQIYSEAPPASNLLYFLAGQDDHQRGREKEITEKKQFSSI